MLIACGRDRAIDRTEKWVAKASGPEIANAIAGAVDNTLAEDVIALGLPTLA